MYVDPARTRYWGDGPATARSRSRALSSSTTGTESAPSPILVYGRVDGGQTLTPPGQWLGLVVGRLEYNAICH